MADLVANNGNIDAATGVPMFIPDWRAREDLNLRPPV